MLVNRMASFISSLASTSLILLVLVIQPSMAEFDFNMPPLHSPFSACYWTYCGEGTCNKDDTFKHTCECKPGYANLMNITHFPCFSSCAIGNDCSRLGVRLLNSTSPSGSSQDGSQGTRFLSGGFHWIGIIVTSIAMALWN